MAGLGEFDPKEYQQLQKKNPMVGPIIGPWLNKLYEPGGVLAEPEGARRLRESEQQEERRLAEKDRLGNRTGLEERWSTMTAPGAQVFRPPVKEITAAPTAADSPLNKMTENRMNQRRSAEQEAVMKNMNLTPKDIAMLKAAQMESDYNKGVINNPNSMGVNVEASGKRTLTPFFVDPSRQIGTAQYNSGTPFEPSQGIPAMPTHNPSQPMYRSLMTGRGATGPVSTGGSDVPIYETVYRDKDGNPVATFTGQNQRVGGGTLSVLGGRTPEEQAAIDASVKQINSQTAALRGLRNANRLAAGGITVEQEEQLNAMRQLVPRPDMSRLDEQQAALMQQLKDAQGIKGFGKRRQREDAMEAAKIGLAQLANQRNELGQQYGQYAGWAQNMMQNQTAQEAAQAKALQDWARFQADSALRQEANQIAGQKNELDATQAGQRQSLDQQRLAIERAKAQREGRVLPPDQKYMSQFFLDNSTDPTKPAKVFDAKTFTSVTGIPPLPEKEPEIGKVYLSPQDGNGVILGPDGKPMIIGLEDAILFDRMIKREQGLY